MTVKRPWAGRVRQGSPQRILRFAPDPSLPLSFREEQRNPFTETGKAEALLILSL